MHKENCRKRIIR